NFSTQDKLKECSFSVRKGEILGVAGLMGAGRSELARAIIGADPKLTGQIYLQGKPVNINSPKTAVKYKIGYLPEDRKANGLVLRLDISKNLTIGNLAKILKGFILRLRKEKIYSTEIIKNLQIKTAGLNQKVRDLSGGNQQKVVVGKWLFTDSNVLIFDEPTRGIDVGAKVEIYKLMVQLAREGKSIIMISSELPEVLSMSDRIVVMHDGRVVGEVNREEASQDVILKYAIGK
ncbi:MAG: ATP-binding cassette domain-containing protein, partial [Christensenellales bacterium]